MTTQRKAIQRQPKGRENDGLDDWSAEGHKTGWNGNGIARQSPTNNRSIIPDGDADE